MEFVYAEKTKTFSKFYRKFSIILIFLMVSVYILSFSSYALSNNNRVVRVGFFDFEGYHETNEENQRGGYGYEYLHEMAKYTGWVFEYVDGTWEECQ
ncbi:MAG: hypothetical protein RR549_00245, partial [Oscillospiraceae bacterium]